MLRKRRSPSLRRCITIKKFIKDHTGEGYVDVAIAMLIIFALVAGIFSLFPIYTTYQSLNATAKQMAHVVEICGQADSATLSLVTSNGKLLAPDDTTIDTTWYNASQKKIQLKTPFTITLTKQILIPILKPVGGHAIGIKVRVSASASGISEVYWKG